MSRDALKAAFVDCRSEVARRITQARATTEQEAQAVQSAIQQIVDTTKGHESRLEDARQTQGKQDTTANALIAEMNGAVHKQDDTVEQAISQSAAILRAGRDVQAMASATRLLSLNARVEASRLGDQGSSFSVIADEMRQLSHAVQQSNSAIALMAKELERILPQISEHTRSIHQLFEKFTRHVEEQRKDGEADVEAQMEDVSKIRTAVTDAEAHLEFPSSMADSLERIDESLERLLKYID